MPAQGQLSPTLVARALRRWLSQAAAIVLDEPAAQAPALKLVETGKLSRRPYFCSGRQHSTSTKVPECSQALAGVGRSEEHTSGLQSLMRITYAVFRLTTT